MEGVAGVPDTLVGDGIGQVGQRMLRVADERLRPSLVLGVAVAAAVTKYLNSLLFELTPLDVTTFLAMPALFAAVAAAASYLPARRAVRLDPQTVLRCDG